MQCLACIKYGESCRALFAVSLVYEIFCLDELNATEEQSILILGQCHAAIKTIPNIHLSIKGFERITCCKCFFVLPM